MGPIKCGPYRDRGFTKKRDTPIKPALSGRHKLRRYLPNTLYETLSEEREIEETSHKPPGAVQASSKPVRSKTLFYVRSPAHAKSTRHAKHGTNKTDDQVSPAQHMSNQVNHKPEAFKSHNISAEEGPPIKDEEQSLTVARESTISSTSESDTTLSFDTDKENCYSSTSLSSDTLPSPEIFRKEDKVEMWTSPSQELLGVNLQIRNSTLLDVSHAEAVQMHHTPNVSSIHNATTILAEMNSEDRSNNRGPEAKAQIQTEPFKSANQAQVFKRGIPVLTANKRPILFKNKEMFKNVIIAEAPEASYSPVINISANDVSYNVQKSSRAEQMKPHKEASRVGKVNSEDGAVHRRVTLKKPVKSILKKEAKFFDFASDSDRDLFFQRMRERCAKLRSITLFPHTDTSVL